MRSHCGQPPPQRMAAGAASAVAPAPCPDGVPPGFDVVDLARNAPLLASPFPCRLRSMLGRLRCDWRRRPGAGSSAEHSSVRRAMLPRRRSLACSGSHGGGDVGAVPVVALWRLRRRWPPIGGRLSLAVLLGAGGLCACLAATGRRDGGADGGWHAVAMAFLAQPLALPAAQGEVWLHHAWLGAAKGGPPLLLWRGRVTGP